MTPEKIEGQTSPYIEQLPEKRLPCRKERNATVDFQE